MVGLICLFLTRSPQDSLFLNSMISWQCSWTVCTSSVLPPSVIGCSQLLNLHQRHRCVRVQPITLITQKGFSRHSRVITVTSVLIFNYALYGRIKAFVFFFAFCPANFFVASILCLKYLNISACTAFINCGHKDGVGWGIIPAHNPTPDLRANWGKLFPQHWWQSYQNLF